MLKIKLPDIGEGINEVIVTDILVSENQVIKKDDIILIVESEKASMEIPSNSSGEIKEILVSSGQNIKPGDTILELEADDEVGNKIKLVKTNNNEENSSTKLKDNNKKNDLKKDKNNIQPKPSSNGEESTHASPSVRKLARELDCNLQDIIGTGRKGRVTRNDILEKVKTNVSKKDIIENKENDSKSTFNQLSNWGIVEKKELNNIKKVTAKRLYESWINIPHVTQFDEIDITELDKIRITLKKINTNPKIKISLIPFFMKTIVKILKEIPIFNTSLSDDKTFLIYKKYYNIGIAVDTPRGLVVPVIKNVDKKSIKNIAEELTKIIYKSKEKRLSIDDMSGGCITISSLGNIGGKFFTPIINPPEVAILGISKFEIKPKLINNKFVARKILPISLSYDHRVIDGADAAKFTKLFADIISNPNLLIDG